MACFWSCGFCGAGDDYNPENDCGYAGVVSGTTGDAEDESESSGDDTGIDDDDDDGAGATTGGEECRGFEYDGGVGSDVLRSDAHTVVQLVLPGSDSNAIEQSASFWLADPQLAGREAGLRAFVNGCEVDRVPGAEVDGSPVLLFEADPWDAVLEVDRSEVLTVEIHDGDATLLRRTFWLPWELPRIKSPTAHAELPPSRFVSVQWDARFDEGTLGLRPYREDERRDGPPLPLPAEYGAILLPENGADLTGLELTWTWADDDNELRVSHVIGLNPTIRTARRSDR